MLAADDRQFALASAAGVLDFEFHDGRAGLLERTGDDAGLRIEREALRQMLGGEAERFFARRRNEKLKWPAGRAADDSRTVDGRFGRLVMDDGGRGHVGHLGRRRGLRPLRGTRHQHQHGAGPIGVVVVDAVVAVADQQRQVFGAVQIGLQPLGRVARLHPPALGHFLAVNPDFERHGSFLHRFVIDADHGDKLLGRAMQVDVHFADGVRADAVVELLAVDLQRIIVDRSARVRLAPSLFDLREVEAFQPDGSLRGLVAGECGLIEIGRPGGGEETSKQQGCEGERTGEAGQHGRLLIKGFVGRISNRFQRSEFLSTGLSADGKGRIASIIACRNVRCEKNRV